MSVQSVETPTRAPRRKRARPVTDYGTYNFVVRDEIRYAVLANAASRFARKEADATGKDIAVYRFARLACEAIRSSGLTSVNHARLQLAVGRSKYFGNKLPRDIIDSAMAELRKELAELLTKPQKESSE